MAKRLADYFVTCRTTLEELSGNNAVTFNSPSKEDVPIVDIAVFFPLFEEQLPPGFVKLDSTPYGNSGNCNSGVIAAEAVFVCFRRFDPQAKVRDKAPIVELQLVYLDKEKPPPGYQVVEKSVSGNFPGNLNYGFGGRKVYLCLKRAPRQPTFSERYHSIRPIVDICILNKTKNEKTPSGYSLLPKSTSEGNWTGSRMRFCIKRATPVGLLDTRFDSTITEKVPYVNHDDFPCPSDISLFCAPAGMSIERRHVTDEPLPTVFSFLLTEDDGKKVHGTCLTFYEKMEETLAQKLEVLYDKHLLLLNMADNCAVRRILKLMQGEEIRSHSSSQSSDTVVDEEYESSADKGTDGMQLFVPICICLISHYPFYKAFKQFATMVYQLSISRSPIPIERFVGHFLTELPVPLQGSEGFVLRFGAGHGAVVPIEFRLPAQRGLPLCSVDFSTPLRFLNGENLATLFGLLLLEKSILIHSQYMSVLTEVAESLRSLLFPVDWQFVYVPVCPREMLGILEAPVPFFVGTSTNCIHGLSLPSGVWVVDIDRNEIVQQGEKVVMKQESSTSLMEIETSGASEDPGLQLPPKVKAAFVGRISSMMQRFPFLRQDSRQPKSNPDLAYSMDPFATTAQSSLDEIEKTMRNAALEVMVALLGNYREFLIPLQVKRSPISTSELPRIFNVEAFISSAPKPLQGFLTSLTRTLSFCKFVDERTYAVKSTQRFLFFDAAVRVATERHTLEPISASQKPDVDFSPKKRTALVRSQSENMNGHKTKEKSHKPKVSRYLWPYGKSRSKSKSKARPRSPAPLKSSLSLLEQVLEDSQTTKPTEDRQVFDAGVGDGEDLAELMEQPAIYSYTRFPRFSPTLLGPNASDLKPKTLGQMKARDRVDSLPSGREYLKQLSGEKRAASFFIKPTTLTSITETKPQVKPPKPRLSRSESIVVQEREAGMRTLEEVHRSRLQAVEAFEDPEAWTQIALVHVFGAWFCCLPRWLREFNEPLRLTCLGLEFVSRNFMLVSDEACYRSLIVACSRCGPRFASDSEQLLSSLMHHGGITPNALTYGYYSNSVTAPSARFNAKATWRKLRIVLKACQKFKAERENQEIEESAVCIMWSMTECFKCGSFPLDQEIMAGWTVDETMLTCACPSCQTMLVPRLNYRIYNVQPTATIDVEGQCEYMNPFALRKHIETHPNSTKSRDPGYWNLLWYCGRLNVYNPCFKGKVVCGWQGKGTVAKVMSRISASSLSLERTEIGTIAKARSKALAGEDRVASPSPSVLTAMDVSLHTLWGNLVVEERVLRHLQESPVQVLNLSSSTSPEMVLGYIMSLLREKKLTQAIVFFLATRQATTTDSSPLKGWEVFCSSMYLEFKAMAHLLKPKAIDGVEEIGILDDVEFTSTLSRMKGIDKDRAELIRETDHAPSVLAQCFASSFGELYP